MLRRELLPALAVPWLSGAPASFTPELWAAISKIFAATLAHPFLTGLSDGTLTRDRFQYYLIQDALYLEAFSRALGTLAWKAPRSDWAIALSRDAIESLETERQMHKEILASFGLKPADIEAAGMSPSNYAYTNHLLVQAERASFAEGLAAALPCYWIYWEVGKSLKKQGSRNPAYQRWIEQYAGPAYGKTVQRVLSMMDEAAGQASPAIRSRARHLFIRSAQYEYLFWDSAWKKEQWSP